MTKKIYFSSNSLEIETRIISSIYDETTELYRTQVEDTIIHPKGGGQDNDIGFIDGYRIEVIENEGDNFFYYLNHSFNSGMLVKMTVDKNVRFLNSRRHSLGHLIGFVLEKKMWLPIKASHYPNDCRVVFQKKEQSLLDINANDLAKEIYELINKNYETTISYHNTGKRIVSFGEDISYMCGGTHVNNLDEIGGFTIDSVKVKKDTLTVKYSIN